MREAAILLVEDDALIRMMIADMLEELGHRVVAETGRIDEARKLAETTQFDVALLDINLGGESITPVAQIAESRGLPFLFISGYQTSGLPERFKTRPLLTKPFIISKLKVFIEEMLAP